MRPFEIFLLLSFPVSFLFIRRNRKLFLLPLILSAAQYFIEGYRWQLVPAYTLALIAAWLAFRKPSRRSCWSVSGWGVLFLMYGVAVALPYVLPVPQPLAPTGPFPVGTSTYYFIDENRKDPYAPAPDTPREILVQVWYPAQEVQGYEAAHWIEGAEVVSRGISKWIEMPEFLFDHLVYAYSSAYLNPPVLQGEAPYPIILFSHGLGGVRAQNTTQAQDLASHGYVVAAIEHTYATAVTVFPDGRIAYHNPDTVLDGEAFEPSFEALVSQWVEDQQFALDKLEEMNAAPEALLFGRLDLQRIMSLGHSTGGATALQFCQLDSRCTAAVGMDPALAGLDEITISDYAQPFFVMFSESWATGGDNPYIRTLLANATQKYVSVYVEGTRHYDFSDLPAATGLAYQLGLKGPIDGPRVLTIINQLTLAYFDQFSRGFSADWLTDPGAVFPEVIPYSP